MGAERPNFLLITTDQHRGDCFGFEGRRVKTPHLDGLARSGTRFSSCIAANPVCQPSRASLLTGLLPNTHGVPDNGFDLSPEIGERGFGGELARAGYRTALIGKAHFATSHTFEPTGTPECRVSSANYGPDWYGPYMGFQYVELVVEGHNQWPPLEPPCGQHYEHWYYADGMGAEKNRLYRTGLPPDVGAMQTFHSALPVAWHNSTWVGDRTIEYLRRQREEPFCLWASFPDPHHPFDAPEPWSRLHDPNEVDLPRHRTTDFERRPWWHLASQQEKHDSRFAKIRGDFLKIRPQTDEQLRHLIANYYGMISLIDHNVGRILITLHDLGLRDRTIVVFTADHGEWLGDHGLFFKGPMLYEGLLRVGLIFSGPGVPAGRVVNDPVSFIDLPATSYDYAGISSDAARHSQSLRPLIENRGERREFAYCEWDLDATRCGVALRLRTVRTRTHKLTLDLESGAGELYDLANDPDEMVNRFNDPAYAGIRRGLEEMIASQPGDYMEPPPKRVGMA